MPTLNVAENITLPMDLAGRKADQQWIDTRHQPRWTSAIGSATARASSPAASSSGSRSPGPWLASPELIFADEPTGNLDSARPPRSSASCATPSTVGQTIVMVTHDPVAASYADRVVFLADGKVVDELLDPTADTVLAQMRHLGEDLAPDAGR